MKNGDRLVIQYIRGVLYYGVGESDLLAWFDCSPRMTLQFAPQTSMLANLLEFKLPKDFIDYD